jgi:hypothetical protein
MGRTLPKNSSDVPLQYMYAESTSLCPCAWKMSTILPNSLSAPLAVVRAQLGRTPRKPRRYAPWHHSCLPLQRSCTRE